MEVEEEKKKEDTNILHLDTDNESYRLSCVIFGSGHFLLEQTRAQCSIKKTFSENVSNH